MPRSSVGHRGSRARGTAVAVAGVLVGLIPTVVRGQEAKPAVDLTWIAPRGCPGREAVLEEVARILGPSARTRGPVGARAVVSLGHRGEWRVSLTTQKGRTTGERTFAAASCYALADATALILALTVDPESAARALPPAPPGSAPTASPEAPASAAASASPPAPPIPSPSASSEPVVLPPPAGPGSSPAPVPTAPRPVRRPPPEPSRVREEPKSSPSPPIASDDAGPSPYPAHHWLAVGAGFASSAAVLPFVGLGGELTLGLRPGHFRVEIAGTYWAPQTQSISGREGEAGRFAMLSVAGRACYAALDRRWELAPCVSVMGSSVTAQGQGTQSNSSGTAQWGAVGAGGRVQWSLLPTVALSLRIEGEVPFVRPAYAVFEGTSPARTAYQLPPVGATGTLGLEGHFF